MKKTTVLRPDAPLIYPGYYKSNSGFLVDTEELNAARTNKGILAPAPELWTREQLEEGIATIKELFEIHERGSNKRVLLASCIANLNSIGYGWNEREPTIIPTKEFLLNFAGQLQRMSILQTDKTVVRYYYHAARALRAYLYACFTLSPNIIIESDRAEDGPQ